MTRVKNVKSQPGIKEDSGYLKKVMNIRTQLSHGNSANLPQKIDTYEIDT
jgi:hypothetical protein